MPNRILKESIRFSETIEELTPEEEVFFYRLLTCCDDYGRFDGRPAIILAACFPLKLRSITEKHIMQWLDKLSTVGLLWIYEVDGKRYLQVTTWDKHQQIRSRKAKYPLPPEDIPCRREHIMPEEKDIEDLLYDVMNSTKRFEEHTLLSVERQVRVGESYLDIVAKTENSETLVFELKRGRLSNKAIDQISKYLTLINGNGILIGCGLSANFDIERCRSNDIAVVIYDDDLNMSIVLGNSAVNSIDLTLNHVKSRYAKLAPNPIQSESESESESESINTCASDDASVCTSDDQKLIEKPRSPFKSLKQQERFDKFWNAYPKQRSKGQAEKTWIKINPDDELLDAMLSSIERWKRSKEWLKDGGQFIPHPSTWLNAKGWEDKLPIARDSPTTEKDYNSGRDALTLIKQMREKEAETWK